MRSVKKQFQSLLLVGMSVVLVGGAPTAVYADDAPAADTAPQTDTSATTPAPAAATTSATTDPQPTNSSSTPSSTQTTTPPKPTYVYDSSTNHWNSDQWQYDTASGTYKPYVQPAPVVAPAPDTASSTSTATSVTNSAIATALNSVATSGDASVLNNTTAGDASTGNASSAATIMNNVNSSMTNADNKQAASFVSNVMGDVNGDIMLQPMLLKAMLEANAANTSATATNNTSLTNDVSLSATSGNALVSGNTTAGSATSGSANTVANVVNVINSLVAANQSFIGTINIYGNLNGDILIAPGFIPQLLAANGSAPTTPNATTVTDNSTQSVVNNIALAAQTGAAVVTGNTTGGSATTGNAATNTVIFNLTNHAIVASDSLLVFVNVLGRWVGVIVDAPTGATAAAIGDGVTSNSVSPSLTVNTTNNALLTNNINLTSQSGNATVSHNTTGGNATTGNATASANIANITGSQIGLSGWFGVLFINVFGSWLGSFGVDTAAGNLIVQPPTQSQGGQTSAPLQVIEFVPHNLHQTATVIQGAFTSGTSSPDSSTPTSSADVLSAMTNSQQDPPVSTAVSSHTIMQTIISILMMLGTILLFGGIMNRFRKVLA